MEKEMKSTGREKLGTVLRFAKTNRSKIGRAHV